MGMYRTHNLASQSYCIDTKWLKDHGYFNGGKRGSICWSHSLYSDETLEIVVSTDDRFPHLKVGSDIFALTKVPCNLGGFRWGIRCNCQKIVYNIYLPYGGYCFACRQCSKIVYFSQRKSGSKLENFGKLLNKLEKYEELNESIVKTSYKGVPTKKVARVESLENELMHLADASVMIYKDYITS